MDSVNNFIYSGVIAIFLSIKGINHSLGPKSLFSLNIIVNTIRLLVLSVLVFLPKIYIIS